MIKIPKDEIYVHHQIIIICWIRVNLPDIYMFRLSCHIRFFNQTIILCKLQAVFEVDRSLHYNVVDVL